MNIHKFATCLNCMDGRVQLPAIQWISKNYGIDYVDMITEAGMDGVLSNQKSDITSILMKINISLKKHGSKKIFIVGHFDCAGNLVDFEAHKKHIKLAVSKLKVLFSSFEIVGLWISENWEVEKIYKE